MEKGDVDAALAKADIIVEGEYRTGAQEQLYIENQGMIAVANPADGVTVWGSLQCPYYVHKALMPLFDLPAEKIRVIQAETGGGFGGKEEYPSMIAGHAALLAWKSGKRVKIIYDRAEDMVATTKRHPSRTRHRTGVTRDGKLLAMDIDFVIDGGAYATLSPVVLSRGTIHAAGPYSAQCAHPARAVATNAPPHGAFRGFGAPQSIFALERQMDQVAARGGPHAREFRRRNFLHNGQTTATGQVIHEDVDLEALLDRAFRESDYHAKRERFARENPGATVKRGIGFASFMHGAGFTGSGEVYLASVVDVEATPEGSVRILAASTEIGQGTNTIFSQIAADALGIGYDRIEIAQPDTAPCPTAGRPSPRAPRWSWANWWNPRRWRSSRNSVDSGLLCDACTEDEFVRACRQYIETRGPLRSRAQVRAAAWHLLGRQDLQGDAYGAFAWAVYVAEVAVDTVTFEARVDDFVAVQEVGKVIHPVLAAGQIEGGVAQGIGLALYENVVWRDGRMANGQMTNYIMPTAADIPPIRVFFEEHPYAFGPPARKASANCRWTAPRRRSSTPSRTPRVFACAKFPRRRKCDGSDDGRRRARCLRRSARISIACTGEWRAAPRASLSDGAAARCAARGVAAHRHERRLRRGRMRRVLDADERRAGEQLPGARAPRRRRATFAPSRESPAASNCTPCSRRFSNAAARSAGSARRAWCSPPWPCSSSILIPATPKSAKDSREISAAAPATRKFSKRCASLRIGRR